MKLHTFIILGLTIFLSTIFAQQVKSAPWQVDKDGPFNEPHSPNLSGLVNWLMRQNFETFAYQALIEYEGGYNYSDDEPGFLKFTNYLPVISTEKFGTNLGVKYSRYKLMTDNQSINPDYQYLWLWAGSKYEVNEKWSILLSAEIYKRGNSKTFNENAGNQLFYLIGTPLGLSDKLIFMPMVGYNHTWKSNYRDDYLIGGFQLKWLSSESLQLMTGLPVIFAIEWEVSDQFNLGGFTYHDKTANFFLRYRFNKNASLSLIFKNDRNGFQNTFLTNDYYYSSSGNLGYDNIVQDQQTIKFELGVRSIKNLSLQISAGYKFGGAVQLNSDNTKLTELEGTDSFLLGMSISFLQF